MFRKDSIRRVLAKLSPFQEVLALASQCPLYKTSAFHTHSVSFQEQSFQLQLPGAGTKQVKYHITRLLWLSWSSLWGWDLLNTCIGCSFFPWWCVSYPLSVITRCQLPSVVSYRQYKIWNKLKGLPMTSSSFGEVCKHQIQNGQGVYNYAILTLSASWFCMSL